MTGICLYCTAKNKSVFERVIRAWNIHPLRTERNWSPRKLWINSILQLVELEVPQSFDEYGIDYFGPAADEDQHTVDVPATVVPLQDEELGEFIESMDVDTIFDDHGIEHYVDL